MLAGVGAPALAQSSESVLLVVNDNNPASVRIGEHYRQTRRLPAHHVVHLQLEDGRTITWAEYRRTIDQPIADWLTRHDLQDQILFVVLTTGIPVGVDGTSGRDGTQSSVDSELSLLYRRMLGLDTVRTGRIDNPYFLGTTPVGSADSFRRRDHDIYLVTRLDGPAADDVVRAIDRGVTATGGTGAFVFDQRASTRLAAGDQWMTAAAERLRELGLGDRVVLEETPEPARVDEPMMGYASWGENDTSVGPAPTGPAFAPGGLAALFRTDGAGMFADAGDTTEAASAGGRIRAGATGLAAYVAEPMLDGTVRPQVLFPAYAAGFTLAEAFYLAMPYLSWQTVVVGDPLVRPFARPGVTLVADDAGLDPVSGLPALFAERRLAAGGGRPLTGESARLLLAVDRHEARGELREAAAALRRILEIVPGASTVPFRLAGVLGALGEHEEAVATYRRILAEAPTDVAALNNLAYTLAADLNQAEEALPLAEQAHRLSPTPRVADTLAWVHHLLGNDAEARPLIEEAVAAAPDDVELVLHAAFIRAAMGANATALAALNRAVRLEPGLADRPEVRALRARLGGAPAVDPDPGSFVFLREVFRPSRDLDPARANPPTCWTQCRYARSAHTGRDSC